MSKTNSARNRLLVGTALAGAFFTAPSSVSAGTCVVSTNPVVCSGPAAPTTDVTQTINFSSTINQVNTAAGFGISTASGSAFSLIGSGTFNDQNASSITGAAFGIYGKNVNAGGLSITTTGVVRGNANAGIYGYNGTNSSNLSINAATVTGNTQGISARNYGSGGLSITATGAVTGTTKAGIFAYEDNGSGLTINAAAVSGANSGINAQNLGHGLLSITTSGAVNSAGTGSPGSAGAYAAASGIYAYAGGTGGVTVNTSGPVTATGNSSIGIAVEAVSADTGDVTITTANTSGTNHGIFAQNYGSGALAITSTGTTTGNTKSGIAAQSGGTLTINANTVNGGASGIYSHATGAGELKITTTGAVTSTGSGVAGSASGIYALASGAGAITVSASGPISATGATSYGVFAKNTAAATGDLTINAADVHAQKYGIYANNLGKGATTITTTGSVVGANEAGIRAVNTTASTGDLKINTAQVTGENFGIAANNQGSGSLSITATGTVSESIGSTSPAFPFVHTLAIFATNGQQAKNLTISVAGVTSDGSAISAYNNGTGSTTITATGAVSGEVEVMAASTTTGAVTVNVANVSSNPATAAGIYTVNNGTGSTTVTVGNSYGYKSGLYFKTLGAGINVTVTGATRSGNLTGFNGFGIGAVNNGTAPTTISITQTGSAAGVNAGVFTAGTQSVTINNQGSIANLSGATRDVAIHTTQAPVTLNNSGTITGVVNLASFANEVDLRAGGVTGTINTGDFASVVNFTGGTLAGAINMGTGSGNAANLTGLTASNLSGATHIDGGSGAANVLTLTNVTYQGGSFLVDNTAKGVNLLTGWRTVNLISGTAFTLTDNLTTASMGIDQSSALLVGNAVNPTIAAAAGATVLNNAGIIDFTNGTLGGNMLTVSGAYNQASTGKLIVGVTPSAIDLLAASGAASLAGTVTFAFAPGTYTASTRTFLTSSALTGTFASSSATALPSGFSESVGYTATSANLILAANTPTPTPVPTPTPTPTPTPVPTPTPTPTPTPVPTPTPTPTPTPVPTPTPTPTPVPTPTPTPTPVSVVAPNNASRFSADSLAFSQDHLGVVDTLLGGGANNIGGIAAADMPGMVDHLGHHLWAAGSAGTTTFNPVGAAHERANNAGIQAGFDVDVVGGRIGVALGYNAQSLRDADGGRGHNDMTFVSIYGSVPLGRIIFGGVVSYAHGADSTDRPTGVGNAHSRRNLDDFLGAVQLSAPLSVGAMTLTPAVGVSVSSLSSSHFSESLAVSPAFALTGYGHIQTSVSPYATFSISQTFKTGQGVSITPFALAGYRYNDAAAGEAVTLTAADGTLFFGNRAGINKNSAVVGAGLSAGEGSWRLSLQYRGTSLGGGWSHQGSLGLQIAF